VVSLTALFETLCGLVDNMEVEDLTSVEWRDTGWLEV
jgi:hypothetical protein